MTRRPRLLALASYPERSAATRFRMTAVLPYLEERGWEVRFEPFVDDAFFRSFYSEGNRLRKASYLASRSLSRLGFALGANGFDAVFVQREAAFVGPAYAERILRSLKGLPIVFDFDDAIWHLDLKRSTHPVAARLLKDPGKCWATMKSAASVIAGSSYLAERAREVNANVNTIPTVVSANEWTPLPGRLEGKLCGASPPRIGWVGSRSTAHQLELVEPALRRLRDEGHDFEVHVVGAGEGFVMDTVDIETRPWRQRDEIEEFRHIDIGLAPMHGAPVYQGKCGFKQLQYMAVGVPLVSSWVGGARDFMVHGDNGLVARNTEDWYQHLKALLGSTELRARLSRGGRELVATRYCIERQGPRVAQCFDEVLGYARAS